MPPEPPRLPVLRAPTREGRCRRQAPGEPEELCGTAPCPMRGEPTPSRGGRGPPLPAITASSGLSAASFAADLPLPCALPRSAVLGPAPGVLPRGVPSRCGAHRGRPAARPGGCRGPSHPSLRSHRGFAKFLPATSVVVVVVPQPRPPQFPERGEPAGAAGAARTAPPACLPARPASLPASPVCSAGQRQNCEACRLRDGRGPGLVGPGGERGVRPGFGVSSPGAAGLGLVSGSGGAGARGERESWEGSNPAGKGGEAAHKGELQLPASSRKEINPNH